MPGAERALVLAAMFDAQTVRWVVWSGLVALTLSLVVLMRTRWGQSHPLRKCIVLSLIAHLLLGIYTTTVNIVTGGRGIGLGSGPLRVAFISGEGDGDENADVRSDPDAEPAHSWELLGTAPTGALVEKITTPGQVNGAPAGRDDSAAGKPSHASRQPPAAKLPDAIAAPSAAEKESKPERRAAAGATATPIEAPAASKTVPKATIPDRTPPAATQSPAPAGPDSEPVRREPPAATAEPLEALAPIPAAASITTARPAQAAGPAALPEEDPPAPAPSADPNAGATARLLKPSVSPPGSETGTTDGTPPLGEQSAGTSPTGDQPPHALPEIYELRVAPDRLRAAMGHGGSRETEAAVVAALGWMAKSQNGDGRWQGRKLEAGRGAVVDGQDRREAGTQADTGLTGLALLAFLASGHTHQEGEHREQVRKGIDFLISIQAPDGNLGGQGTLYERMYCHAMATFALSECCAMSQDDRLRGPVRRAIHYTLAAQQPGGGGWRYQPGDPGDMSQLGWQFMALKSAELAGIPIPSETRQGMLRFIGSVTSGHSGGLAGYRPGHRATRTMTAEALVCRQFLGLSPSHPACDEAGDFLLSELPGSGTPNFYYWYYGTLAMYQVQGQRWERWNEALQKTLVGRQWTEGPLAGSWDPDPVWGTCGGRAYSTALGTLCLEVYYRYLPFYIEAASRGQKPK